MRLLAFGRDREEAEDMMCWSERMSGEEKDRCRETSQVVWCYAPPKGRK
jgi:hypothetical protein